MSNENSTLELVNPVNLTNAADAVMTFSAKWNIEPEFDFVQVSASTDGGSTWTPVCGKYTNAGSMYQQPGEPLYDGNMADWVEEEMILNDFLGQNVLIRFRLVSDGFAEYDYRNGEVGDSGKLERIRVPTAKPAAALMFENFAAMVGDSNLFEASVAASERTQEWLDASWTKAIQNERS